MGFNENGLSDADITARMKLLNNSLTTKTSQIEDKPIIPFKREIVWKNVAVYVVGHTLVLYSIYLLAFHTSWLQILQGFVIGYGIKIQGIQMGAHRYYAHRCFKASKAMQVIMLIAQTAASQNCMWVWVRDHRLHHKYTDTDADPHNAKNGFFFSHVGWLLSKKHPEVIRKGKMIDMSDLDSDPLVMFQKRHYVKLWLLFAIVIPMLYPMLVFKESVINSFMNWVIFRLVYSLNVTWLVNSWAHLYGAKPFDKNIMPGESYFVAFLTQGEGWHNYHHVFPWDYKTSELGNRFTFVTTYIGFWARLGMVWDLKEASNEMILARAQKAGDGTPYRAKSIINGALNVDLEEYST